MKTAVALLLALATLGSVEAVENQDRTITKVVKLLQGMLDQSKTDGDTERTLYGKYKCYCDTNDASKTQSIKDLTKEIGILESDIEALQGDNGGLSSQCSKLRSDMMTNEESRSVATAIRNKAHEAFVAEETDLTGAIGQMGDAIKELADIGADQTMAQAAGDNKQFLAGFKGANLLKLQSNVQKALTAATIFMEPKAKSTVESFLQAPFTGSYSSQSGAIVGILKNMRDTFKANLATARASEKQQLEAFNKLMKTLLGAYNEMSASYDEKQEKLGSNDGGLSSKKAQLEAAENQKAEDEDFLAKLKSMCAEKTADYEERKQLRANEDAAIAEAISILDSDAAFATFGKADATKSGGTGAQLIQLKAVRAHTTAQSKNDAARLQAQRLLQNAKSSRLSKIVSLLKANNPFTTVLEEIEKMIDLIAKEGNADKDNLDWCNSERETNEEEHYQKETEIRGLNDAIATLESDISSMKDQIQQAEEDLEANHQRQVFETKERAEENMAYQKDVGHLVDAQDLLTRAIKVLTKYYASIADSAEAAALLQDAPAPPSTWKNDSYKGQSEQGGGAIGMLEYILEETKKEEGEAHKDENDAQHAYEDSMQECKDAEAGLEKSLVQLHEALASAEKELLEKKEDLIKTTEEKEAIEAYLLKIKPGCDFITTNFETRESNRATEKAALENAVTLIKGTPAFQAAETAAHQEGLGKCKDICNDEGEDHAKCKACLADVTVPGYCAGHAGTTGC